MLCNRLKQHLYIITFNHLSYLNYTMWPLSCVSCFINPMNTISISTTNHGHWSYLHQLSHYKSAINPGWWFQTFGLFSIIYGIILPIDYYFSRWLKPPTRIRYSLKTSTDWCFGTWMDYGFPSGIIISYKNQL